MKLEDIEDTENRCVLMRDFLRKFYKDGTFTEEEESCFCWVATKLMYEDKSSIKDAVAFFGGGYREFMETIKETINTSFSNVATTFAGFLLHPAELKAFKRKLRETFKDSMKARLSGCYADLED